MILDISSGNRGIWFNKHHPHTIYVDLRENMRPSVVADSCRLPFPNKVFDLVVFDPWPWATWSFLRETSQETSRVALDESFLSLKWTGGLGEAMKCFQDEWEPLFGHALEQSSSWVLFKKKAFDLKFAWE